jgi:hypothetical protein
VFAVDVWTLSRIEFLTVQIKERALQFLTPLYLPPGQKKSGVSGHTNYRYEGFGVKIAVWFKGSSSKQMKRSV